MFHLHDLWVYEIARGIVTYLQSPLEMWHPVDQGFMFISGLVLKVWDNPLALILANLLSAFLALGWLALRHRSRALFVFYLGFLLSPYGIQSLWRIHPEGYILLLNVACFELLETRPYLVACLSALATWIYPTGFFMFFGLSMIAWTESLDWRVWTFPLLAGALNGIVIWGYPWKEFHRYQWRMLHILNVKYEAVLFAHPFAPWRWVFRGATLLIGGSDIVLNQGEYWSFFLTIFNASLLTLFLLKKKHGNAWLFAAGNAVGYCLLDCLLDSSHQGIVLFWLAFAILESPGSSKE
jgi:hypothetical protein